MKLFIVARNKNIISEYKKQIKLSGFKYGRWKPEIILSLGGDGTYLVAEKKFPGVPKLLIRDSRICNKCSLNMFDASLSLLKNKNYRIEKHIKLEGAYKKSKIIGANDIVIRNKNPQEAIRFHLKIDGKLQNKEYIGDGVVISTPWGSTGYFESITKKSFIKGLGIALNNLNTSRRDIIIKETASIEVIINRGRATLSFDNNRKIFVMKPQDSVIIKKDPSVAKIIKIKK